LLHAIVFDDEILGMEAVHNFSLGILDQGGEQDKAGLGTKGRFLSGRSRQQADKD
jgi:hypothetical protein